MNQDIDARILKYINAEFTLYLEAAASCPPPVAQQVASLIYYAAEVHFQTLNPWYTPPRLLGSNAMINILSFKTSGPAILQAFTDLTDDLMEYHYEHDSAVLRAIQRKCADGLASVGLQEVAGIMSAIRGSR